MGRQTEWKDHSNGQHPGMAVIRAGNRYYAVYVAQRLSERLVVIERYAEGCPARTKPTDALVDVAASVRRAGKHPEDSAARLTTFAIAFGWLLLAYGAVQREAALRLEVDPVSGLVGYVPQLAGEIRFIGNGLLFCDPLVNEETLLDHLRGTAALARMLPEPTWYCFERLRDEAGGAHLPPAARQPTGASGLRGSWPPSRLRRSSMHLQRLMGAVPCSNVCGSWAGRARTGNPSTSAPCSGPGRQSITNTSWRSALKRRVRCFQKVEKDERTHVVPSKSN